MLGPWLLFKQLNWLQGYFTRCSKARLLMTAYVASIWPCHSNIEIRKGNITQGTGVEH